MSIRRANEKGTYWYRITVDYCPVCGSEDKFRERIYDKPKPSDYYERVIWKEYYDWCDAL